MKSSDFLHHGTAPGYPVNIEYKGVFDMQDLYESIAQFFHEKKYKFYELFQRQRSPSPFGKEVKYHFMAERNIEHYYKWIVNITLETYDMQEVEVVLKNGHKKKMAKGRVWIQIKGKVETDYDKAWEHSAFLAHLKSFYNKYVIRRVYEGVWWDEMYYNLVLKLHSLVKERLKMMSEVSEHRHFSRTH
jgi:hypothetical protein